MFVTQPVRLPQRWGNVQQPFSLCVVIHVGVNELAYGFAFNSIESLRRSNGNDHRVGTIDLNI